LVKPPYIFLTTRKSAEAEVLLAIVEWDDTPLRGGGVRTLPQEKNFCNIACYAFTRVPWACGHYRFTPPRFRNIIYTKYKTDLSADGRGRLM
jgi:hypothetical protein